MRSYFSVATTATVGLVLLGGCSSTPEDVAAAPSSPAPSSAAASAVPSAPGTASAAAAAGPSADDAVRAIRATDWNNFTLHVIASDRILAFHGGIAQESGGTCRMLPDGAKPVYADLVSGNPDTRQVFRPGGEEALILVRCAQDASDQLDLVAMFADGPVATQYVEVVEHGSISSYSVSAGVIVATVQTPGHQPETRRYVRGADERYTAR